MSSATDVQVRHFARVFVDDAGMIPPDADAFKSDRGYGYRLYLDNLPTDGAGTLVEKAAEHFDVEIVGQVIEDGRIMKERRYVENPADVPEGYAVQRGPQGGVFYETNPLNDPSQGDPSVGDVTVDTGYDGEPMLAVQFEDVEEGDRIAYEMEGGEKDMGRVISLDDERRVATVESEGGAAEVAAAPLDVQAEKEDAGITSDTAGVHNDVFGGVNFPDECRRCGENDRQEGSMYCAECEEEISKQDDSEDVWVYYWGPRGGEGWQNLRTGEIRYQKHRPGPAPEDGDGYGDWLAEDWHEPPDDLSELQVGQTIETRDNSGEFYEDEITGFTDDGEPTIEGGGGHDQPLSEMMLEEVTAVKEYDRHEVWFEDAEVTEERYWNGFEGEIPDDVPEPVDQMEVGGEYDLMLPNGETVEDVEIWGYLPDDHDIPILGSGGPVIHYDDLEAAVGEEEMLEHWGPPGDASPTITIPNDKVPKHVEGIEEPAEEEPEPEEPAEEEPAAAEEPSEPSEPEEEPGPSAEDAADAVDADAGSAAVSEDAVGEAVDTGDGLWETANLEEYHPDDIAAMKGMDAVDSSGGNTVAAKEVVDFEDGTEAVYTNTDHHTGDPDLGDRAVASAMFARAAFEDYQDHGVPEIKGEPHDGYFFTGVAPGQDALKAPQEYVEAMDEEKFYRHAGLQVMLGNNDAHVRNVKLDEDGDLHWFDMDHAGGPIDFDDALAKSHKYEDGWDRTFGELARTASPEGFGLVSDKQEARTKIFEAALDLAEEIDEEQIEAGKEAASEHHTEYAETIAENIKKMKNGDYPYEP
jgi:hypothetical protein